MRISTVSPIDRTQSMLTAGGLISANYPPQVMRAGGIPTAGTTNGTAVFALMGMNIGDVVTNVIVYTTVAGAALTFAKVGLYDSAGNFLAASASAHASFNSGTGFKTTALSAPYTIRSTGGYYAAFLQWGSGATGATLGLGLAANLTPAIGTGKLFMANVVTQTDLSANQTLTTVEANNYWFGVN